MGDFCLGRPQVLQFDNPLPPSRLLIPQQETCSSAAFYSESRRSRRKRKYVDPIFLLTPSTALNKFDEPTVNVRKTASLPGASCWSSFSSWLLSCRPRPMSGPRKVCLLRKH